MEERKFRTLKDLPSCHRLGPGTSMCPGCGGLEALREVMDVLGERTVIVNAAGCMTLLAIWPYTPFSCGWLYTAMASAPAGAQGVRDALDILIEKGRIAKKDDLEVVVLTGDGAAYGMGLSATSSAIERGLDFICICYDNEGFGNTGQQYSEATPFGAKTSTSRDGHRGHKKDLFSIWAAHRPAYIATAIGSDPLDLSRKVATAAALKGPRLILALSPCPTGWGFGPEETVEIGRLAVRTGIWPLKEYKDGKVVHTYIPKTRLPVEEYLVTQGRFSHLFRPETDDATIREIQSRVDSYWASIK